MEVAQNYSTKEIQFYLKEGIDNFNLYSLNDTKRTIELCARFGLTNPEQLQLGSSMMQ